MTTPAGGPEWWLGMYRDVRLKTWSYSKYIKTYTLQLAKNWWAMIWTHHWDIDMNAHLKYFEVVWWNSASNNTHANDQTDQSCKIALSEAFHLLRFADCALAHSHTHTHCHRAMAHSTLMSHEVFPKIGYDHDAKHHRTACPRPQRKELYFSTSQNFTEQDLYQCQDRQDGLRSFCRKVYIFFSLKFKQMRAHWNQTHWIMMYHPFHKMLCITPSEITIQLNEHIPSKNHWETLLPKVFLRFLDRKPAGKRNWQILSRLRFGICENNTAMDTIFGVHFWWRSAAPFREKWVCLVDVDYVRIWDSSEKKDGI